MQEERFITVATVQRELALSPGQVATLIEHGELPAIRILGHWRIERTMLEQYIGRAYEENGQRLRSLAEAQTGSDAQLRNLASSELRPTVPLHLTPQLTRVLQLVAQGFSNLEIAQALKIEVSTVKSHVSHLLSQLGVRDRENLIVRAWSAGLVSPED